MAPIGDKPFLEYILKYLKKNGIDKVVLSIGYKWETIKEYFGDSFEGIELVYSVENEPLGTGGAIKQAMEYVSSENVFIVNGDTFFDIDLKNLSLKDDSKIILSLKSMSEFDRYGCVEYDENFYVTQFTEKGYKKSGNINGGIYLVKKNIFNSFELPQKFSFEDFLQENFRTLKAKVQVFDSYFIDIGIPEDYSRAQQELKRYI